VVLYQLAETSEGIRPLWISENIYRLFGYRPGEVFKDNWWQGVVHPDDLEQAMSNLEVLGKHQHLVHEYRILDANGRVRHVRDELQYLPAERPGQLAEIVGSWSDLTESREQQDQLKFLTHYDTLTHLPNKVLLLENLRDALARARNFSSTLALLSIDLDRFKTINESLGYAVGDRLLLAAAERLRTVLVAGDMLARVGGDEFVLLIQDRGDDQQASETARKILQRFSVPLRSDEHELALTVSIGISLFPGDGQDEDNLLKNAEIARYAAKQQGRNRFQFFASELSEGMRDHLFLENALRGAIERNELLLHYQPQLDLSNPGRLIGIEALIRWQHPELGLVPPDKFIPLAEEIGLIGDIGLWVLKTACEQMVEWDQQQFRVPRVSVNLAAQQIETGQLPRQVRQVLKDSGLAAERLELELTESTILREPAKAISDLVDFRTMGVSLAVDDFGTGYSSLAYLKRLPIDRLKIDRSFVHDIGRDPGDEAICRAIIQMARALGLETVAEGIERKDQAAFLLTEGCQYAQGFLYSRPLSADELYTQWQGRLPDSKVS
jgi:diguanylate cyclase (GGDEF)-like protein/PAS domain S-box-containing protein